MTYFKVSYKSAFAKSTILVQTILTAVCRAQHWRDAGKIFSLMPVKTTEPLSDGS